MIVKRSYKYRLQKRITINKSKNLILYLKQPIELEKQLPTIQILKEF